MLGHGYFVQNIVRIHIEKKAVYRICSSTFLKKTKDKKGRELRVGKELMKKAIAPPLAGVVIGSIHR